MAAAAAALSLLSAGGAAAGAAGAARPPRLCDSPLLNAEHRAACAAAMVRDPTPPAPPGFPTANYWNTTFLWVELDIDRAVVNTILPAGLTADETSYATLYIAHFPVFVAFPGGTDHYHEVGFLLHVTATADGRQVTHTPYMLVDVDTPLYLGRDMAGYPKKLADSISITDLWPAVKSGEVAATATRRGPLVELKGTIGAEIAPDARPPVLAGEQVNVWGPNGFPWPHLAALPPSVLALPPQLLSFSVNETITAAYEVHLTTASVGGTYLDPIGSLIKLEVGRDKLAHVRRAGLYETIICPVCPGGGVPKVVGKLGPAETLAYETTFLLRYGG